MTKSITPSKISVAVILLIMTTVSSNLNWGQDHWKDIIRFSDRLWFKKNCR
jgi:hypothetical protein